MLFKKLVLYIIKKKFRWLFRSGVSFLSRRQKKRSNDLSVSKSSETWKGTITEFSGIKTKREITLLLLSVSGVAAI
jgi:hypothetical protein